MGVGVGVLGRQKEAREAFFGACIVPVVQYCTVRRHRYEVLSSRTCTSARQNAMV